MKLSWFQSGFLPAEHALFKVKQYNVTTLAESRFPPNLKHAQ
jgi:hypothetical protein